MMFVIQKMKTLFRNVEHSKCFQICMGHLILNGFRMMDHMVQTHRYDKSIVSRFEKVYHWSFS